MPAFEASCPVRGISGDGAGHVRLNGKPATVKKVNDTYYEASRKGFTASIALDGGELIITYTGKNRANGVCQVTSQGAAAAPAAGTGSRDEKACLQAVTKTTNNSVVTVLSHDESEANNTFIIGVGPQKAKWQCLVKNGIVAEVMSLTDEGAL
ncbi:MAG: hypothetical protein U1E15_12575 [Hyphomicrobiales bacterium]